MSSISSAIRKWLDRVSKCTNYYEFPNDEEVLTEGKSPPVRLSDDDGDSFEPGELSSSSDRVGTLYSQDGRDSSIYGRWVDNLLEGLAEVTVGQEGVNYSVYHEGVLHGMTRKFGLAKMRNDNLKMVAFYDSGRIVGKAWKGLLGGAFLVGTTDDQDKISGDDCVYIYPDLYTVIVGKFRSDHLVSGWTSHIEDITFFNHVLVPKVSRRFHGQEVTRDVATNRIMSNSPLQPDHWEEKRVEARTSLISADNAGEGLFAKIDFRPGDTLALFNGVRIHPPRSSGNSYDDEGSDYRIRFNSDLDLDIPEDMVCLDNYRATLAHKANHSFRPNARWSRLDHARFGLICAVTATEDIGAGEEILVNYGLGMSVAPSWYKDLWVRHCREEKGMSDGEIKEWCDRQYAMNGRSIELPLLLLRSCSREKA